MLADSGECCGSSAKNPADCRETCLLGRRGAQAQRTGRRTGSLRTAAIRTWESARGNPHGRALSPGAAAADGLIAALPVHAVMAVPDRQPSLQQAPVI